VWLFQVRVGDAAAVQIGGGSVCRLVAVDRAARRGAQGVGEPADPEAKGLVERLHDYLERSFLPGRRFVSPQDFNSQLAGFLARANSRQHRVLGCRPLDRVDADRQAMLALPPVPPTTGWRQLLRLPRDHYVRLDGNDYSVDPAAIGRRVVVSADLDRVRVTCDGSLVADHERVWAKHQTISDPKHLVAAKALRRNRIDLVRPPAQTEVEIRSLAAYDAALGIATGAEERMA
jgi:transposase